MTYELATRLVFCRCGEQAVFFDEEGDRYFRLGARQNRIFTALIEGDPVDDHDVQTLLQRGILISPAAHSHPIRVAQAQAVEGSALEGAGDSDSETANVLPSIALAFGKVLLRQRFLAFTRILDGVRAGKLKRTTSSRDRERACAYARAFAAGRRRIPISPVCLADSLALIEFLTAHDIIADLVLGVKMHPFAAHCWVQCENFLLNENVDHARRYTPILVV